MCQDHRDIHDLDNRRQADHSHEKSELKLHLFQSMTNPRHNPNPAKFGELVQIFGPPSFPYRGLVHATDQHHVRLGQLVLPPSIGHVNQDHLQPDALPGVLALEISIRSQPLWLGVSA